VGASNSYPSFPFAGDARHDGERGVKADAASDGLGSMSEIPTSLGANQTGYFPVTFSGFAEINRVGLVGFENTNAMQNDTK
jgi:hypothetical protein